MVKRGWWKFGVIAAVVAVGVMGLVPGASASIASDLGLAPAVTTSTTLTPHWNTGNLCSAVFNDPAKGDVQCVSTISNSPVPLTYNFSAGTTRYGVVNITIQGSKDCIYLNFHSFYTTIDITVLGSGYGCANSSSAESDWALPSATGISAVNEDGYGGCGGSGGWGSFAEWGGGGGGGHQGCCASGSGGGGGGWGSPEWSTGGKTRCGPGINIVINSEGDTLNLVQGSHSSPCGRSSYGGYGGNYATNVTIYGATTFVNATMNQSGLNTTVTYIGMKAGFKVCPSGIIAGRVHWAATANGNRDTFGTIFVDGTNVKHAPPNEPYTTEPLGPPDGIANGFGDVYANETTTVTPPGTCGYVTP